MTALDGIKDGGTPRGPDGGRHVPFEYATAIHDGEEVGMLYSKFYGHIEWITASLDYVVDLEDCR